MPNGRVGNKNFIFFNFIYYNKVILFPVCNTRQRCFFSKCFPVDTHTHCMQPDAFRCIADSHKRNTFPGDIAFIAQCLQCVGTTVMLGYHAQTRGSAIHCIKLFIKGKLCQNCELFLLLAKIIFYWNAGLLFSRFINVFECGLRG